MFAVVIVNWNSGKHLYNCINSLNSFNSNLIDKIVIVDNNSHNKDWINIANSLNMYIIKIQIIYLDLKLVLII